MAAERSQKGALPVGDAIQGVEVREIHQVVEAETAKVAEEAEEVEVEVAEVVVEEAVEGLYLYQFVDLIE